MTLDAGVHEALVNPTRDPTTFVEKQKIFDDTRETPDAGPHDLAEYLYIASQGENLSGRSTNIPDAFASSLAVGDHSGGVGVTSFIGASPSNTDPNAAEQLEAFATWKQDFANNGSETLGTLWHLEIPALEVGLFNVVPEATTFRGITETAEAEASLAFVVTHADGSTAKGSFEFGLRVFEQQVPSGAQVFNVVAHKFIGDNTATLPLFNKSFHDNGDSSNPRLFLDALSTDVDTGDLAPGDTLDVVYQLSAKGTTNGGEQGFIAFLGDPFELDGSSGGFTFETTTPTPSVPEPSTWVMMIVGFGLVAGIGAWRCSFGLLRVSQRGMPTPGSPPDAGPRTRTLP
jgi:hypothetical protein